MRYRPSNFIAVALGLILLLAAAVCNSVTLASGDYRAVLLASFVLGVRG